jgi:hypothetical protein
MRNEVTKPITMSGGCAVYSATLPILPVFVGLDLSEKISDAVTADTKSITTAELSLFLTVR